ncbi:small primase-like protein with Toprim domain [Desulfitobacterium dichloroeliminans LMG P-21439]|uniref:Small primase-like protein with Toprim domain n=1 Tax=Desulfitobacterium dichloroeliminans (strain LMG P-21439 / DCA1) TaxID=871963 RepID=L0F9Z8_DESDL|nr:toprim domain-containing protein [Desulfitobacterium dichloroeliminans]AGA69481.1 small primase-like protein with Toprim domain [Desulfitobacterium dichloroeliminans LMG P-21439]
MSKIIIVEGKTDKERLQEILVEPVEILCSHGTMGYEKIEEWATELEESEVYLLVDADDSGEKIRKNLQQELPNIHHLYTHRMYREVATTPLEVLAQVLEHAHFEVREIRSEEKI